MPKKRSEDSPRDRLLQAADQLFYAEGIHSTGIDRLLAQAGVAKASLYSSFGSKDALVAQYLEGRDVQRRSWIQNRMAKQAGPRERILSVFELLGDLAAYPQFRGCAFVNASAEAGQLDNASKAVVAKAREWLQGLFAGQARQLGAPGADELGRQLCMLYDGTAIAAAGPLRAKAAAEGRAMADLLLTAATGKTKKNGTS
jgi:AcrR family transcriptional regulator